MSPSPRAFRAFRAIGGFALLCLLGAGAAPRPAATAPEDPTLLERRVKAAFLYRFASYVEWPAEAFPRPDSPLVLGVLGEDRLARVLGEMLRGKKFGARPVEVTRITPFDPAAGVHVLFIGRSEESRLGELVRAAGNAPTLIVTESENALVHGSMINFLLSEGRVRFEISLPAVARARLAVQSGLLTVAHSVRRGPTP